MPFREKIRLMENRIVSTAAIAVFLVILAGFAGLLLNPRNTLALIEPCIQWFQPSASSANIERFHVMIRDFGHFLIPAAAFGILVIGPLRNRPLFAFGLCVSFAVIDESFQNFMPGRTGSIADVAIDTSGAMFAYFAYLAIIKLLKLRKYPAHA